MPCNYASIKEDNVKRYGTDINRIGPMLLANRYDNQAHFIYELLQNAEDAVRRRGNINGSRVVKFHLQPDALQFSHYGELFSERDVKGICGIAESTKSEELTTIGRFGIGFKAVYGFTNSPEIHSGNEHFAIDSYVWPRQIEPIPVEPGQTIFRFPFKNEDASPYAEILAGLRSLTSRSLLFLREIEEISWSAENVASGVCLRQLEPLSGNARRVTLISETAGAPNPQMETWLVLSREVKAKYGSFAGYVEIAFSLTDNPTQGQYAIQPIKDSNLIVFFPTVLSTNLGFLLQGPFRTTPSRDNVPQHDPWNLFLVEEASSLVVEGLQWLKENGLLTVDALRTLPIDSAKFQRGAMLFPISESVKMELKVGALLPAYRSGYASGRHARLARTKEIRDVFSGEQLALIYDSKEPISWLSEDITINRVPELRTYLMSEINIGEVDPETIIGKITAKFLASQSDAWIAQFYAFLLGQPALWKKGGLNSRPIIRLDTGDQVAPFGDGELTVFLPGLLSTGFPTVKRSICENPSALDFLRQIGLHLPDPVDDVVVNILPKYKKAGAKHPPTEYESDISRILSAASTDSKKQKEKLQGSLREAYFVVSVDMGDGSRYLVRPDQVYQATQKLRTLFQGVPGVLLVDDSIGCLSGVAIRDLLEGAGASEYLQQIRIESKFNADELTEMRRLAGYSQASSHWSPEDWTLRGLEEILEVLPNLQPTEALERSKLLWDALCDVEDRRGSGVFSGTYSWTFYQKRSYSFDAYFVTLLNEESWVPLKIGELIPPSLIRFEDVPSNWRENPFLQSRIKFKPAIIDSLAKEAGIDPAVLDFLRRNGITSEAELIARLKVPEEVVEAQQKDSDDAAPENEADAASTDETGAEDASSTEAVDNDIIDPEESQDPDYVPKHPSRDITNPIVGGKGAFRGHGNHDGGGGAGGNPKGLGGGSPAQRTFISYISLGLEDTESDGDDADHKEKLALEERAIDLILSEEPELSRTPTNNPGFDLTEATPQGQIIKYVEVKAMAGPFHNRPVCMSKSQFEMAQEHGIAFWLYVVENLKASGKTEIIRIQNPAGKARSFSFDHGWKSSTEGA